MVRALPVREFISAAEGIPVIDVRSPGEFARGHLPGARSLPLFSDAERATVGTLYKQQGRDAAVLEGLRHVGPRMAALVEEARRVAPEGRILVHCWRGGERSASVAWLLDKAGFGEVRTLAGGYKAFRTHVLDVLASPWHVQVIGGCTGSGKTELLGALAAAGEPVIDLEALAGHRGSAFGLLDGSTQPTTEQFENRLWRARTLLPADRAIWVEDESRSIGRIELPHALYDAMRQAAVHVIEVPIEARVERLVREYGPYPKERLAEALYRIRKRMGPQHHKAALQALEQGDLAAVARLALTYYDRAYRRGLEERAAGGPVTTLPAAGPADLVHRLIAHVHR